MSILLYIIIGLLGLAVGYFAGMPIIKKQLQAQANLYLEEAKSKAEAVGSPSNSVN